MRVLIRKRYYKRSLHGRNPMVFSAKQPKGIGTDVHAVVLIDPVLKRHTDIRKSMLKHEKDELVHWGKGKRGCSHLHAKKREPLHTRRLRSVSDFWSEIKRRQK